MSLTLATGPASSNVNHASNRKTVTAIETQALTIKNVRGVQETVRAAWLVQELRGVVAVVDIISAVRGLAHKEAAHFFSEHKENWQRSQTLELERIALTEITGNGSSECIRPMQDVEVCPLADLHKVIEAIAAVQGQPAGADDVCSRLERSVQEWARIRLEQRLRELSDDQANIKMALQSVFASRDLPKLSSAANQASSVPATTSVSTATSPMACARTSTTASSVPQAPLSNPPAPRSNPSTSLHGSPYIGPASGVPTPLTGFWLYDPAPPAPSSRGGGSNSGARLSATTPAVTSSTGTAAGPSTGPASNGSPCLAGQPLGLSISSIGQPASHGATSAAFSSLLGASSGNGAGSVGTQAGQLRKRPREAAVCIPAQALSFNQMTGGPELFRCTLCGVEVANRDDGAVLVSDVAVALCGHLYCTGCLAGSMLSGLPDEVYKCRRCGLPPLAYDRVRPGLTVQRVEPFKGLPSEYWLLPDEHRRFLLPDTKGGEKQRRGVVLTISSRGAATATETRSATRTPSSPSPSSPSPSPVMTRGLSPSLPPITTCAANTQYPKWPQQHLQQGSMSGPSSGTGCVVPLPGGQLAALAPHVPRHESCALYAGQLPNDKANGMLRKLCGYFWFSLY